MSKVNIKNYDYPFYSTKEMEFHIWNKKIVSAHNHQIYEIAVCVGGDIEHIKNDEQATELHKKDAIIIFPHDKHSLKTISSKPAVHYNMSVSLRLMDEICEFLHFSKENLNSLKRQIYLTEEEFHYIKALGDRILISSDSSFQARILKTLLVNIISTFIGRGTEVREAIPTWLTNFINEIRSPKYYTEQLKKLYKLSGYSQTSLSAYFRRYYNKSFVEFYTEERIKYACTLLKTTSYLIIDIANMAGFSSLSHFNKTFKKIVCSTPKQFRSNAYINC